MTSQIFLSSVGVLTLGGVEYPPFVNPVGPSFFDADGGLNPLTTFFPGETTTEVKLTLLHVPPGCPSSGRHSSRMLLEPIACSSRASMSRSGRMRGGC